MISFITLDVLRKTSFMTCIHQCTVSFLGQVLARGICPLVLVDWMRWRCSAPTAWMLSLKIVNHGFNQLTRNDKHLSFKEERKTSEVCCSSFSRCYINFGKCYCNVRNSTLGTIQSEKDSIDGYWVHGGGQ